MRMQLLPLVLGLAFVPACRIDLIGTELAVVPVLPQPAKINGARFVALPVSSKRVTVDELSPESAVLAGPDSKWYAGARDKFNEEYLPELIGAMGPSAHTGTKPDGASLLIESELIDINNKQGVLYGFTGYTLVVTVRDPTTRIALDRLSFSTTHGGFFHFGDNAWYMGEVVGKELARRFHLASAAD